MKNLHLNEKHLADKLQHVPVPDVDQSWEQMKELLEREMPRPVGGAWSGNRKWWAMGITVGLIMLALWVTQELNESERSNVKGQTSIVKSETENGKRETANVKEETEDLKGERSNVEGQRSNVKSETADGKDQVVFNDQRASASASEKTDVPANTASSNKTIAIIGTKKQQTSHINKKQNNTYNTPTPLSASEEKTNSVAFQDNPAAIIRTYEASEINNELLKENSNVINTSNIQPPPSTAKQAIPGKTDRAFAREVRQKSMKKDNRRMSGSSMRGNFGDDGREITFAAGLTLPQSLAIGSQQSPSYNINANKTRVTDYLPAPFFQYHLNNKLFLQTEFHFQSPQYTDRLLLNTSSSGDPTVMRIDKNVYLEKLYYFNIPLNLYYTPMHNVSVGGGLQYSSFLSGVASYEERRTGPTASSFSSVARRFKDDSLASRFAPSEFRYQLDANYYFNRFTLGVRYTQAMKDFMTVAPVNNVGLTRNKSFLLYLRFNIWEERKKGGMYSAYNY